MIQALLNIKENIILFKKKFRKTHMYHPLCCILDSIIKCADYRVQESEEPLNKKDKRFLIKLKIMKLYKS